MNGGGRVKKPIPLLVAIAATVAMALWMANRQPFAFGPLWGALITLAASTAWVAWLVPTAAGAATPWQETALGKLPDERLSPIASAGLALAVMIAGATIGGYERLPITILVALLCFVPAALRRPGLMVMIAICAIYLPLLGTTSLWDPWETHYGEVAREILARNDWISLWWAQDKWFWSKPALLFWMEALSMGFLGIDFMPDANPANPEWSLRLPTLAMSLAALAVIYATIRRYFGPRAAALATLVTATMPQFFFISHQAITDLPLVAAITIAACSLIVAMQEDGEREATVFQVGRWRVSLQHVLLFAIVLLVLPQAVYLISRNISWVEAHGLVAHPDRFLYGSAGNVDIPGNPNPRDQAPRIGGLGGQPFVQGILWLAVLSGLSMILRKERRTRALLTYAFYLFCGIAFMAKGLLGLAIPGAAALFYLVASRRWALLGSGELRVSTGVLIVTVVSLPWYLAMYVRHGGEPALVSRDVRATRPRVHQPAPDPRPHQPAGERGPWGHRNRRVLPRSGRLRDVPVDWSDPRRSDGLFFGACEIRSRFTPRVGAVLVGLAPVVVRALQRDGDQVPPLHSSHDYPGGHSDRNRALPVVGSEAPGGDDARGCCRPVRDRRLRPAHR
jgi:hypothetical protein